MVKKLFCAVVLIFIVIVAAAVGSALAFTSKNDPHPQLAVDATDSSEATPPPMGRSHVLQSARLTSGRCLPMNPLHNSKGWLGWLILTRRK
jgi:hypothetical protein